jgi:hypothetical protein
MEDKRTIRNRRKRKKKKARVPSDALDIKSYKIKI